MNASTLARRFLEQVQRAGDVDVDEGLAGVAGDMRLVQRGRVQNTAVTPLMLRATVRGPRSNPPRR
jgi:hypothetical protein